MLVASSPEFQHVVKNLVKVARRRANGHDHDSRSKSGHWLNEWKVMSGSLSMMLGTAIRLPSEASRLAAREAAEAALEASKSFEGPDSVFTIQDWAPLYHPLREQSFSELIP